MSRKGDLGITSYQQLAPYRFSIHNTQTHFPSFSSTTHRHWTMKQENQRHRKGLWTEEEDRVLSEYIGVHGRGHWNLIPKVTGLKRCGKSCRLRWLNYLSPNVKRGGFSEEEEDLIIRLHKLLGNRWSLIAGRVPGRTDNQVKNHWNTNLSKKLGIKNKKPNIKKSIKTCSDKHEPDYYLTPALEDNSNSGHFQDIDVDKTDGEPLESKINIAGESSIGHYDLDSLLLANRHFDLGFLELFDAHPFDMISRNDQ